MAEPPSVEEFFSRVLVWHSPDTPGFCNLHFRGPNQEHGFDGRPYTRLKDFMAGIGWLAAHPSFAKDVWFATGQQLTAPDGKALRSRANTALMKSIFLDIDVKDPPKGYANLGEALDALKEFVLRANIPMPSALVSSGSGLHVYWISDRPLSVAEWQPYADGLRALADQHGLRCDGSVTIDCARVLRVPGTFNSKTDPRRLVKLLGLAKEDMTFDVKLGHIRGTISVVQASKPATGKRNWMSALESETPDAELKAATPLGTETEYPPIDIRPVIKECPFFRHTFATGGKGANQGLWMMTVLATTFVQGGQKVAHLLSNRHKTYNSADTDAMYERKEREKEERGLGWPSCTTFEQYGSKQCADCPYHGRIKSPLNLHLTPSAPPAQPTPADSSVPGTATAATVATVATVAPAPWWLPKGYTIHDDQVHEVIYVPKNGRKRPVNTPLILKKITGVRTERNVGVYFSVEKDLNNQQEVLIDETALGPSVLKVLSSAAVLYNTKHPTEVINFMTSFMKKVWEDEAAEHMPPYGWAWIKTERKGWTYAGVLYKSDGTTASAGRPDQIRSEYYTPCGEEAPFFEALKLITDQHRPALEVLAAASFGTPLLEFTGAPSGCIAGISDTASNKTTACNVGLSVWGQPTMTKIASSASILGTQAQMAELKDLPTYCDDVRTDTDGLIAVTRLIRTVMEASQGAKLNQDGTARNRGQWKSILIITSNKSVVERFAIEAPDNAAGLMRIFEFGIPHFDDKTPGRVEFYDADILQQKLDRNFGRIGERYSALLATSAPMLTEYVHALEKDLSQEVEYQSAERFWIATLTCIIGGAVLANRLGANFHIDEIHDFLVTSYKAARQKVLDKAVGTSTEDNVTNALTRFFKAYPNNMLHTTTLAKQGVKQDSNFLIQGPDPGTTIHVHWVVNDKLCRISRDEFERFCQRNNSSFDGLLIGLKKHYGMEKLVRANLGSGTPYVVGTGKETLIVLPVEQPWMLEILYRGGATRSGLSVVSGVPSHTASNTPEPAADQKGGDPPHL